MVNQNFIASILKYELFHLFEMYFKTSFVGFPGDAVVENLPANAGDTGSNPGLGGSHMPQSN